MDEPSREVVYASRDRYPVKRDSHHHLLPADTEETDTDDETRTIFTRIDKV